MNTSDIIVINNSTTLFECWNPVGLRGKVILIDKDGGVCVELIITDFFRPSLWFPPTAIMLYNRPKVLIPPNIQEFEGTFPAGRRVRSIDPLCPIGNDLLRSWFVIKLCAMPGQRNYKIAMSTPISVITAMFEDNSDKTYQEWLRVNDMQNGRTIIMHDVEINSERVAIKRPKII